MQAQSGPPSANIANPCSFTITQGRRAGQPCGRRATKHDKSGNNLCVTHYRMSTIPTSISESKETNEIIHLPELKPNKEKQKRKKVEKQISSSESEEEEEYEYKKPKKAKRKQRFEQGGFAEIDYNSLWTNNVLDGIHSLIGLK